MKRFFIVLSLTVICSISYFMFAKSDPKGATPDIALERLMEGNGRYISGKLLHPDRDYFRRQETVALQTPYAIILGCADSRVSPEIIFDQGIGDLFVVRVAGNVVGPLELDSIEYSALYLNSSIIMVLGHKNCGAVTAVINGTTKDIEAVATLIQPAVDAAKLAGDGDLLERSVKTNVHMIVEYLQKSPVIAKLMQEKKIKVVGGYYQLDSGKVEIIN